jgi:phosphatidate cytidylyltransferase
MPLGLSDNLIQRVVSAVLLLPVVLWPIYAGGWWFAALLALGGALMALEWATLTRVPHRSARVALGLLTALMVVGLEYEHLAYGLAILSLLVLTTVCGYLLSRTAFASFGWWLCGAGYVGMPLAGLLLLRDASAWLVFWVFLVVWATDVGGYFAGKGIGGPRLAPRISPKKTWAGLLGGVALSALVTFLLHIWFGLGHDMGTLVALGALLAVWAQIGDLAESAIKRYFDVKDSGGLIPGHGGLLDRVDGLVFVAPAVAFLVALCPDIWF